jgi:hypothetical protein
MASFRSALRAFNLNFVGGAARSQIIEYVDSQFYASPHPSTSLLSTVSWPIYQITPLQHFAITDIKVLTSALLLPLF